MYSTSQETERGLLVYISHTQIHNVNVYSCTLCIQFYGSFTHNKQVHVHFQEMGTQAKILHKGIPHLIPFMTLMVSLGITPTEKVHLHNNNVCML